LVKPELIAARLERLREYIKTLKAILKYDAEKFKADVLSMRQQNAIYSYL